MSKVICDLCGTSYSETADQCPICGCARPVDVQVVLGEEEQQMPEQKRQPVKGGRFSKANVRKRNSAAKPESQKQNAEIAAKTGKQKKQKDPDRGLVITVFVLLFAIFAVIAYIVITFFGPSLFPEKEADIPETKPTVQPAEAPTDPSVPCEQILLEEDQIVLSLIGDSVKLNPVVEPADTTDAITYFTDNDAVAIVNAEGVVTALSSGEAVITVICGEITVPVQVTVLESIDGFALNRAVLEFTAPGEQWLLYDGPISMEEVVWASDDEWVATVEDGYVTAITGGTTTIYASYNGQTVSCVVNCLFESLTGETFEPTEAADETEATEPTFADNGPYQIKNLYGFSNSDATIRVGESFTLSLVDKNGDKVTGVVWSVVDGSCCTVEDGVVTGTAYGQAKVVAAYNGESHSFIVRVQ